MLRRIALLAQLIALTALVLATRCANRENVFVAGHVYFTDADCYARMTRVRICARASGNGGASSRLRKFPGGHGSTYDSAARLSDSFARARAQTIHVAADRRGGSVRRAAARGRVQLVSVVVVARMKLRYGWVVLLFFAVSPILVHGTELGPTGPPGIGDRGRDNRIVRGVEFASCSNALLEPNEWDCVGNRALGFTL